MRLGVRVRTLMDLAMEARLMMAGIGIVEAVEVPGEGRLVRRLWRKIHWGGIDV